MYNPSEKLEDAVAVLTSRYYNNLSYNHHVSDSIAAFYASDAVGGWLGGMLLVQVEAGADDVDGTSSRPQQQLTPAAFVSLLPWCLPVSLSTASCLTLPLPCPHPSPPPLPRLQHLCYCGEKLKGRYTIAKHFHSLMRQVAGLGEILLQVDKVDHQPLQGAVSWPQRRVLAGWMPEAAAAGETLQPTGWVDARSGSCRGNLAASCAAHHHYPTVHASPRSPSVRHATTSSKDPPLSCCCSLLACRRTLC
jgi:hypothetical protein